MKKLRTIFLYLICVRQDLFGLVVGLVGMVMGRGAARQFRDGIWVEWTWMSWTDAMTLGPHVYAVRTMRTLDDHARLTLDEHEEVHGDDSEGAAVGWLVVDLAVATPLALAAAHGWVGYFVGAMSHFILFGGGYAATYLRGGHFYNDSPLERSARAAEAKIRGPYPWH